jgi:hypothetical protein
MRFGRVGCGKIGKVDCEWCPRRATAFMKGEISGTRSRVCALCYNLMKRSTTNVWPRAGSRKGHRRAA